MFTKLKVHNFKALVEFEIELKPFTVLIGPNASGKSTILQAIDFIKWFGEGNPKGFLAERGWESGSIRSKLTDDRQTIFNVELEVGLDAFRVKYLWHSKITFPVKGEIECNFESIEADLWDIGDDSKSHTVPIILRDKYGVARLDISKATAIINADNKLNDVNIKTKSFEEFKDILPMLFSVYESRDLVPVSTDLDDPDLSDPYRRFLFTRKALRKHGEHIPPIKLPGSALSLIDPQKDAKRFILQYMLLYYIERIRSFELLSPRDMRRKSRMENRTLGSFGEFLSSFIHGLNTEQRKNVDKVLHSLYTNGLGIDTKRRKGGWTELILREKFGSGSNGIDVMSPHISDGVLRLVAFIAAIVGIEDDSTLLFDEIENGIYPELGEGLIDFMVKSTKEKNLQIITTTHSPAILNWVPEDSVIFVWRNKKGHVKAKPLFEIPDFKKRLGYMGPGDVWSNTRWNDIVASLEKK
jgi:predicted ATPase